MERSRLCWVVQQNIDDLKQLVKDAKLSNMDIEYHANVMKEAVSDYKDNNLVNACLLQFPYGTGGMHEKRYKNDGSLTNNVNISEYIEYLSMQSLPQFQRELFTLILYNMEMKQKMVRTASWKVRDKADAHFLATEITVADVNEAISSVSMTSLTMMLAFMINSIIDRSGVIY